MGYIQWAKNNVGFSPPQESRVHIFKKIYIVIMFSVIIYYKKENKNTVDFFREHLINEKYKGTVDFSTIMY